MKHLFNLSVILMLVGVVSCQKEISWPAVPTGPVGIPIDSAETTAGNGLLVKTVTIARVVDSTIVNYTYDANMRLQTMITTFYSNSGIAPDVSVLGSRFYRDDQGRIVKIAAKNVQDDPTGPDSLYTAVFYQVGSMNVAYTIATRVYSGKTIYDSTEYTYNAANNVSRKQHFYSVDWPSKLPAKSTYEDYTYDANNNVLKDETFSYPVTAGVDNLQIGMYYTYDDKKNGYDKGMLSDPVGFLTPLNNPLTSSVRYLTGTSYENSAYYDSYVYASNDKPISSISGSTTDTTGTAQTFFYYAP